MMWFVAGLMFGALFGAMIMAIIQIAARTDVELEEGRQDILLALRRQRQREWVEQHKTRPRAAAQGRGDGQADTE
jgi:hypothetical protein